MFYKGIDLNKITRKHIISQSINLFDCSKHLIRIFLNTYRGITDLNIVTKLDKLVSLKKISLLLSNYDKLKKMGDVNLNIIIKDLPEIFNDYSDSIKEKKGKNRHTSQKNELDMRIELILEDYDLKDIKKDINYIPNIFNF